MTIYAKGSFSGNYELRNSISEADCVIGHEFGWRREGFGEVNKQLARFIARDLKRNDANKLPLLLNKRIAGALSILAPELKPELIVDAGSVNYFGTNNRGTKSEIDALKTYMEEKELSRPLVVAQAYHVGRAATMLAREGYEPVVIEGLPADFDRMSEQSWTRSRAQWVVREALVAAPGLAALSLANRARGLILGS